jgi:hypothetical protein
MGGEGGRGVVVCKFMQPLFSKETAPPTPCHECPSLSRSSRRTWKGQVRAVVARVRGKGGFQRRRPPPTPCRESTYLCGTGAGVEGAGGERGSGR